MTVSRVLNNEAKVSEDKRKKVLDAVKALNYRPNVSARRLASSKSFFIGLVYTDLPASYVSSFLLGALKTCRSKGYHLIVDEYLPDNKTASLSSINELIDVTRVDGIILLPPISDNEDVLALLQKANIPYVRVAPDARLDIAPYVCIDDYNAAYKATEQLIKQGHSKIAHIIGSDAQGASRLRYQGFLDALRSNQISVPPSYIVQGQFTYQSGVEAGEQLMSLDDKPTAIFAANDEMAAGVLTAAHKKRINIPDEISVVGFDDTTLATTVSPHLTTVRQPIDAMAVLAVELLASGKFSDGKPESPGEYRHVLDFEFIQRESSQVIK
ncbi:transcriptional regulator, LacI family [Thalassotalea agarivorans]|uniref:Transcriptional regulator, LacI family n=2 Tax=Thalassotalea agarivorans TaxID=349064 RepID=A0A1I0BUL0_THASX|nr:transcriptional regulator, LacI family [Thalassotalea agarivorans]